MRYEYPYCGVCGTKVIVKVTKAGDMGGMGYEEDWDVFDTADGEVYHRMCVEDVVGKVRLANLAATAKTERKGKPSAGV